MSMRLAETTAQAHGTAARVTVDPQYFERQYQRAPDPWQLESRWYDQRKYAVSTALLTRRQYRAGFEPGCSVGVLSQALAARCDRLLCWDLAEAAVKAAKERLHDLPHVQVEHRAIPLDWPTGSFDLIVFSEILYYLGDTDLRQTLDLALPALEPDGTLLAVHWRHPVPDHARDGDDVHQALADQAGLLSAVRYCEPDFVAEVFIRTNDSVLPSVAQATGLV